MDSVPILRTDFHVVHTPKARTRISHSLLFRVTLVHSRSFIFTVYRPQDDGIAMFYRIAEKIDIFSAHPSTSIHICSGFNIHHI